MKTSRLIVSICIIVIVCFLQNTLPYGGKTHGGITNQAESKSKIIDKYLRSLGYSEYGSSTIFRLELPGSSDCNVVEGGTEGLNANRCWGK
jgi:hypothetical protein